MTSRIYYLEARNELLKFARMKSYAMSTLLFPLMFYCFFGLAMGPQAGSTTPMARYLLATYGAFAIMGSTLYAFGAGIAVERGLGWLEVKRASPMPAGAYFFAKGFAAMVFGATAILLLFALGAVFGGVRMAPAQWLLTFVALVAGAIPFCALGLIIGNLAGPNSAPATVNMIYMPLAFCGGLWLPFEFLPKAVQQIAPLLPSYHLAQIALAIQNAPVQGTIAGHVEALAAFGCLFLGVALDRAVPRTREDVWLKASRYETAAERSGLDGIRVPRVPALLPVLSVSRRGSRVAVLRRPGGHGDRAWFSTSGPSGYAAREFSGSSPPGLSWASSSLASIIGSSVFFVYGACLYGKVWEPPIAFRWLAGHLVLVAADLLGAACWRSTCGSPRWSSAGWSAPWSSSTRSASGSPAAWPRRTSRPSTWPKSPNANASRATCTTCWATRSRSSC